MINGRRVFEQRKCAACHVAPEYTSSGRYDVGLKDEVGHHEFNPPSLRGVSNRDSFLHDGRAGSLEDVFLKEKHPRGLALSAGSDRPGGVPQDALASVHIQECATDGVLKPYRFPW